MSQINWKALIAENTRTKFAGNLLSNVNVGGEVGRVDRGPTAVQLTGWILEFVFAIGVPRYVFAVQFHRLVHRLAIPVCH